jgi:hypothetical protein
MGQGGTVGGTATHAYNWQPHTRRRRRSCHMRPSFSNARISRGSDRTRHAARHTRCRTNLRSTPAAASMRWSPRRSSRARVTMRVDARIAAASTASVSQ